MNSQQQRMAAIGTDKELSDLLDFSAVGHASRASCRCAVLSQGVRAAACGAGLPSSQPSWTPEL